MSDSGTPPRPVAGPEATLLPRVFLHIGTMKSGTSYIQGMLWRNREALRRNGVYYPGEKWADQVDAVRDALAGPAAAKRGIAPGTWPALVEKMLDWSGSTVIVSMELLSFAGPPRVREIVESLAPAEVDIVVTARDLNRVIPSAWQESTQNKQTWTWRDYLASISGVEMADPLAHKRFWQQHDLISIVTRWGDVVGRDRVHLVTVPQSGGPRDALWRRFCSVVGLAPDGYEGAETVRGNPAIGAASAEFLRRLNAEIGRDFDPKLYDRIVKRFLAKNTLAHREDEPRLKLPAEYADWARESATEMIDWLQTSGVPIAGDLEDLRPRESSGDGVTEIAEKDVALAAVHGVEALVLRLAGAHKRQDEGGGSDGAGGNTVKAGPGPDHAAR